MFTKRTVKFEGSEDTASQETVWSLLVVHAVVLMGRVTERPATDAARARTGTRAKIMATGWVGEGLRRECFLRRTRN